MEEEREYVELMTDEVCKPIDKAKFIISNVYYYIRYFYNDKLDNHLTDTFPNYLQKFKNKIKKKIILEKFSFDLLNKSCEDKSTTNISNINSDNNSEIKKTNDDNYYDLLYNKLINIIHEQTISIEDELIESFISLRNCFIFLEYLYLFLENHPDKISHYIIKIDISLLLDIPQKNSKRLINSDEFFYLNLIELKGLFPEIDYTPSSFIIWLGDVLTKKYLNNINYLENQKLIKFESGLNNLIKKLSKYNLDKLDLLIDDLSNKKANLKKEFYKLHINDNELIKKYILSTQNFEKKTLNQILNEIDDKNDKLPEFNYLYLIALNSFNELIETEKNQFTNEKNKNSINILKDEKKEMKSNVDVSNLNIIDEDEKQNKIKDKDENMIKNIIKNQNVIDNLKEEKEKLIEREELIGNIKFNIEREISELIIEDIDKSEDKYEEYIKKHFTHDKVFKLENDNIYNILCFLEIYKKEIVGNIDNIYLEYKNKLILSFKNLNSINYKQFYDIISDKNFHGEIITILKSEPIKNYITKNRYFDEIKDDDVDKNEKIYKFEFPDDGEPYVENFSKEYNKLLKILEDIIFFINLFRLKYLPFGVKAFVNYNLKIIFNSLYYKFNEQIDGNNKIIIFKAALKILIIHEIMHIFKFLKNDANFNEMPKTPRKREAGKMLMNYLFGIPTIKSINLDEANKLNDIQNWTDVNLLRKIFHKDNELIEKKSFNKNIDYLDLYFTEDDIDDENIKKVKVYEDIGLDID